MPKDSRSLPDRSNWQIYRRAQSNRLYALALIDKQFTNVAATGVNTLAGATFNSESTTGPINEFVFDVNPKTMDLEEPAAVTIVPTQDGGMFIEHQGQLFKDVAISGTTGLRPGKKTNLIPVLGVTNPLAGADVDPSLGMNPLEESGFDRLIALRNLFRRYFDMKEDPALAPNVLMVWQNGKEGEFYVVEPKMFRTKRDASSPLTYLYEIQLQTIGRVDFAQFRPPDFRQTINSPARFYERVNQVSRQVSSGLSIMNALADRTVGVAQATITAILRPARELLNALTGFTTTAANAFAIPRNSLGVLATSCRDFSESLNRLQGETNAYKTRGISTQLSEVTHAALKIQRSVSMLASEDRLFSQGVSSRYDARKSAYKEAGSGRPARTGGSPTNLRNSAPGGGTGLATLMGHDNIFSAAQRLLGDQARWKELVVLNDLKAPYVDPTGDGTNVLRPGDKILIPVNGGSSPSGVVLSKTKSADRLDARLGRDILLEADSAAGGIPVFDLSKNSRGDIAVITGMDNLKQAIEIKFSTEQGELPTHPGFGIRAPIGSKALVRTLVGFQMNARSSLLADSRISTVKRLGFGLSGNTVNVQAELAIADVDQAVAVSFDARR